MAMHTQVDDDGSSVLPGIGSPSSPARRSGQTANSNSNTGPSAAAFGPVDEIDLDNGVSSLGSISVRITARFKRPSIKVFRSGEVGEDFPPSETLKTAREEWEP
jgi:hypothetical protein